jgi:hypothetical protein
MGCPLRPYFGWASSVRPAGGRSADRIIDEYQHVEDGDLIPMFHESHGLAIAYKVDSLQVNEWMVWVHRPHKDEQPDSTWSWRLAVDSGTHAPRYSHEAGLGLLR